MIKYQTLETEQSAAAPQQVLEYIPSPNKQAL